MTDSVTGPPAVGLPVRPDPDRALRHAAQEFEGVLLGMLLKEARLLREEGFLGEEGGLDLASGLAEPLLGRHLAAAGGLGVAETLLRALRPRR